MRRCVTQIKATTAKPNLKTMRRVCTTWITVPLKLLIMLYEIDTKWEHEKYYNYHLRLSIKRKIFFVISNKILKKSYIVHEESMIFLFD